jgi:hypothetical protein
MSLSWIKPLYAISAIPSRSVNAGSVRCISSMIHGEEVQ